MDELISVIVPIYGVEEYLDKCISSICEQTYPNLEIILVDDGSEDKCPSICDKWAKIDSRICVVHKKNEGVHGARQAGLVKSHGDYIGFVDGDDYIDRGMYENLMKLISEYNVDVVESGVINDWGIETVIKKPILEEGVYKQDTFSKKAGPYLLYGGSFFCSGVSAYLVSKLFSRKCLYAALMTQNKNESITDDVMTTYPCIANSRSLYISHSCYYHYRVRNNSLKRSVREGIVDKVKTNYEEWVRRFIRCPGTDGWERQIQYFILYLLLSKGIFAFDNPQSNMYLTPFGRIMKKDRIIIYGAGMVGYHIHDYIQSVDGARLVGWVDKNYKGIEDERVSSPQTILNIEFDYVLITVLMDNIVESIRRDLKDMGIQSEKVLWIQQSFIENPNKLLNEIINPMK